MIPMFLSKYFQEISFIPKFCLFSFAKFFSRIQLLTRTITKVFPFWNTMKKRQLEFCGGFKLRPRKSGVIQSIGLAWQINMQIIVGSSRRISAITFDL
jgi:hypothetical protein